MRPHRIAERLYQSGTSVGATVEHKRELVARLGITAVINLWHDDPDWLGLVPYYWHVPSPDGSRIAPSIPAMALIAAGQIQRGGCVLVMCHAGRNRSGLLTALTLRQLDGISGEQALSRVRAARPRAVANPSFAAYLEDLP